MKKILLTLGACALAIGANAQTIENMLQPDASTFENGEKNGWSSWGNESSSEIAAPGYDSEYCLQLNNVKAGDDYYTSQAAYDVDLVNGTEYMIRFWAKCDVENGSVQFAYQNSSSYSGGGYTAFNVGTDWTLCEKTITCNADDMNRILINFGKVVGTYYIDDIEFGPLAPVESGDNPEGVPAECVVLLSGNTADGNLISAWNVSFTSDATHAGKSCIEYVNEETVDSYSKQIAIDYDYAADTMYYLTFDVMGTPSSVAVGAWYQDKADYSTVGGYSTFNTFTVSSEDSWQPVVLKGMYEEGDAVANRIVINLGGYVGTAYFTNFRLYGPESSGVNALESVSNATNAVYNLQGVKVGENLDGLHKGIYIVNGKKVLVK